jgi:hypothetical protein
MTDFSEAVNAKGVSGRYGLNAIAKNVTGNLGGTVNPQFYALEKQYNRLGAMHPSNLHQQTVIQHQRSADLAKMRGVLGKSILGGPSLGTSMDHLNTTMNKATDKWAQVGKELQPMFHFFAKMNLGVAKGFSGTFTNPATNNFGPIQGTIDQWISSLLKGIFPKAFSSSAATAAFQTPGLSSQSGLGAVLASFTQGNNQSLLTRYITASLMGTGSANAGGIVPASYTPGISTGGNQAAFVKQMQPYANQVAQSTGLSPAMLLTQWGLESGWGTSQAATQNNNFGGIKPWGSYGAGADSTYAGYSSLSAFAKGAAAFYNDNSNYRKLENAARNGASASQQVQLLGQSGYATNPHYAEDLLNLVGSVESLLRGMVRNNAGSLPIPNAAGI